MDIELWTEEERNLEKLSFLFKLEMILSFLFFGASISAVRRYHSYFSYEWILHNDYSLVSPYGWLIVLMIILTNTIISPFIVYFLFIDKKWKWLIFFILCVIVPSSFLFEIFLTRSLYYLVPLMMLFFFVYFICLKSLSDTRLEELLAHMRLTNQKEKAKKEKEMWENQFK